MRYLTSYNDTVSIKSQGHEHFIYNFDFDFDRRKLNKNNEKFEVQNSREVDGTH